MQFVYETCTKTYVEVGNILNVESMRIFILDSVLISLSLNLEIKDKCCLEL